MVDMFVEKGYNREGNDMYIVESALTGSIYKRISKNFSLKEFNIDFNDYINDCIFNKEYEYDYDGGTIQTIFMEKLSITIDMDVHGGISVKEMFVERIIGDDKFDISDEPIVFEVFEMILGVFLDDAMESWKFNPDYLNKKFLEDIESYNNAVEKDGF